MSGPQQRSGAPPSSAKHGERSARPGAAHAEGWPLSTQGRPASAVPEHPLPLLRSKHPTPIPGPGFLSPDPWNPSPRKAPGCWSQQHHPPWWGHQQPTPPRSDSPWLVPTSHVPPEPASALHAQPGGRSRGASPPPWPSFLLEPWSSQASQGRHSCKDSRTGASAPQSPLTRGRSSAPQPGALGGQQRCSPHFQRPSVGVLAVPGQGSHGAQMVPPLQAPFPISLRTAHPVLHPPEILD